MDIHRLGIKNFRSFKNTGNLELRPINILVGKNSSGKSSIARLFPLLRQSFETKTKGPILWFGQYIDFGSFENSVSNNSTENSIELEFDVELDPDDVNINFAFRQALRTGDLLEKTTAFVKIYLSYSDKTKSTFTSGYEIELFGNSLETKINENGWIISIHINQEPFKYQPGIFGYTVLSDLVPTINLVQDKNHKKNDLDQEWEYIPSYCENLLINYLRNQSHGRLKKSTLMQFVRAFGFASDKKLIETSSNFTSSSRYLSDFAHKLKSNKVVFNDVKRHYILAYSNIIISQINTNIKNFFTGVKYIKPLRATAQRYYRYQELAVEEIDSEGANIAMFLEGLTYKTRSELNNWLQKTIGIAVSPTREGGHLALMVKKPENNTAQNIADMGFGYSQVLPILVQAWFSSNNPGTSQSLSTQTTTSALIIEQPELHLHPDFQAKLGDVFAEISMLSKKSGSKFPIVIETHSAHIINRLGELVAKNVLSEDDVSISLFDDHDGYTKISNSTFNSKGFLENWPYGFFEPGH